MNNAHHISVMKAEAIDNLQVKPNDWYLDATFGRGGHTQAILDQGGNVIAFDVDQEAIEYGQEAFASYISDQRLILLRSNFEKLETEITTLGKKIDGILFDFGTSTNQLMSEDRGFSFNSQAELDMRMDQRLGVKAIDLLNVLPEKQLAELFFEMGGEREGRKIAKALKQLQAKNGGHLEVTAAELAEFISKIKHEPHSHLHPATKVFQALRIAVNQELDSIKAALPQALKLLSSGGRIITIAFHEGEDRLVKQYFRDWSNQQKGKEVYKHIIEPSPEELAQNPRARSAKMRVFEV